MNKTQQRHQERLQRSARFRKFHRILPCHCGGHAVFKFIEQKFEERYPGAGYYDLSCNRCGHGVTYPEWRYPGYPDQFFMFLTRQWNDDVSGKSDGYGEHEHWFLSHYQRRKLIQKLRQS